jgi:hypothetical protein
MARFINPLQIKRDKNFDWRTFFASSMFFLVVLVNPRDFPVHNVPLIYPAFLLFVILIGPYNIRKGFLKTRFLCILIISYWFYFRMIILIKGGTFHLGHLAYLIEPLIIIGAVGMATIRPSGTKAALWALVSMITLSTACGIWIYFIGEPLITLRSMLHSTVGGNLLYGEFLREIDLRTDITTIVMINAGLSYYIFSFSYQLAVATMIILAALLSMRLSLNIKHLALWGVLLLLFVGIIINTQRATIISMTLGLMSFFLIKGYNIFNFRTIITSISCLILVFALLNYTSRWEEHYTIHKRSTYFEEVYSRGIVIPMAAIESIIFEPLGAGGLSNNYKEVAYRAGWITPYGIPRSAHNHFANVIMYTGIIGIILLILLFRGLWRKIKHIHVTSIGGEEAFLAAACITAIVQSFTHNGGFFSLEPATLIVFSLLWGATATTRLKKFKQIRTRFNPSYITVLRK